MQAGGVALGDEVGLTVRHGRLDLPDEADLALRPPGRVAQPEVDDVDADGEVVSDRRGDELCGLIPDGDWHHPPSGFVFGSLLDRVFPIAQRQELELRDQPIHFDFDERAGVHAYGLLTRARSLLSLVSISSRRCWRW